METLLLEIGTEEIPAGYIEPALESMRDKLIQKLENARIDHGKVITMGTPRRLAVMAKQVAETQKPLLSKLIGPPEKIGFDKEGSPTKAAEKFAEKAGVPLSDLKIEDTDKGRYICVEKREDGLPAADILKQILPQIITEIPFPKSMRWADIKFNFARPIRYIAAIFGQKTISFKLANIQSGCLTAGHRFMQPDMVKIDSVDHYKDMLKSIGVIADIAERKEAVKAGIIEKAAEKSGSILPDPELIDIVANLVESPFPVIGQFDKEFLDLPDQILITTMRKHQKYFAVVDKDSKLMPYFIAVNNTKVKDPKVSANGHEKVIRARLKDAQFFYQTDRQEMFSVWNEKLKSVLFQAKLGTMAQKTERVKKLAKFIGESVQSDKNIIDMAAKAALLCKADLVSSVVTEFPELQGIMGSIYAKEAGEHELTAAAIEQHYQPIRSGGQLPDTLTGAIVSIADKIDSICGCFSAGLEPTGTADPYALRRQGIGIIQIILDKNFKLSIKKLIQKGLENFEDNKSFDKTADKIYLFLKSRMAGLLAESGYSKDVISAVLEISAEDVYEAWNKVKALEIFKQQKDFSAMAEGFKRAANILKKAEIKELGNADEKLFEHEAESKLFFKCKDAKYKVEYAIKSEDFDAALKYLGDIKDSVDDFFDKVMVMADDENIRLNRLYLLSLVSELFRKFADFSKITV